jgi:hypothetical protein
MDRQLHPLASRLFSYRSNQCDRTCYQAQSDDYSSGYQSSRTLETEWPHYAPGVDYGTSDERANQPTADLGEHFHLVFLREARPSAACASPDFSPTK